MVDWRLLNASDFGVPSSPARGDRCFEQEFVDGFEWPEVLPHNPLTVGEVLKDMMAANGWVGAERWAKGANDIAPTIVGGSKKHGGPDLGPTRARKAWAALGVEGRTVAESAPDVDFWDAAPDRCNGGSLQGFPVDWQFYGRKTSAYRQVGNASHHRLLVRWHAISRLRYCRTARHFSVQSAVA